MRNHSHGWTCPSVLHWGTLMLHFKDTYTASCCRLTHFGWKATRIRRKTMESRRACSKPNMGFSATTSGVSSFTSSARVLVMWGELSGYSTSHMTSTAVMLPAVSAGHGPITAAPLPVKAKGAAQKLQAWVRQWLQGGVAERKGRDAAPHHCLPRGWGQGRLPLGCRGKPAFRAWSPDRTVELSSFQRSLDADSCHEQRVQVLLGCYAVSSRHVDRL